MAETKDLQKRPSDLKDIEIPGSSPKEIGDAFKDALNKAKAQLEASGKQPTDDEIFALASKMMSGYIQDVILFPYLTRTVGGAKAEQLGKLLEKVVGQQDALTTAERELFANFYKNVQAEQNKALKNWVDLNIKIREDAYEAVAGPLKFQANMASLISGIGAIVSVFPGHEDLGRSMMTSGETMARIASQKIMALESELKMLSPEEIRKRAEPIQRLYETQNRKEAQKAIESGLTPDLVEHQYGRILNGSGQHFVTGRESTSGFKLPAYDDRRLSGLEKAMNAASPYDTELRGAAAKYGLDWRELKLRMLVESGGQATKNGKPITSVQGAVGLMQFMPETAKGLGIDPTDPKQSIHGAAQLMAEALVKHGGRTDKLDSEYYGGSNQAAWGPNTKQYVENLKKLRLRTMGQEVITYKVEDIKLAKAKDTKTSDASDILKTDTTVAVLNNPEASTTATAVYDALMKRMGVGSPDGVKQPYDAVAHLAQAPTISTTDIKGLRQSAAALSHDGDTGERARPTPVIVPVLEPRAFS